MPKPDFFSPAPSSSWVPASVRLSQYYAQRHAKGIFETVTVKALEQKQHQNTALWAVYGSEAFSTLMCCQIVPSAVTGELNIWAYVGHKKAAQDIKTSKDCPKSPFRALGMPLFTWLREQKKVVFFGKQSEAMAYLTHLSQVLPAYSTALEPVLEEDRTVHEELTQLNLLAIPPMSRLDQLFLLLGKLTDTGLLIRLFRRVRARLIYQLHHEGRSDASIAQHVGADADGVRQIREALGINREAVAYEHPEEDEEHHDAP